MTFQELLKKADFEKMFEYIAKFYPKTARPKDKKWYKKAYDILMTLTPKAEEGEYARVTNYKADQDEPCQEEVHPWCMDLEGCKWEHALGFELEIDDAVKDAPLDMIAGICLWHLTFYGFTPEQQDEYFDSLID